MLFKNGKSFSVFPFKVIYILNGENECFQAGFTVSSNKFKKAVDRNRIKRLMRECYRLQKHMLTETDSLNTFSIFFIYTGNSLPDYHDIFPKIGSAIKRLTRLINENPAIHT